MGKNSTKLICEHSLHFKYKVNFQFFKMIKEKGYRKNVCVTLHCGQVVILKQSSLQILNLLPGDGGIYIIPAGSINAWSAGSIIASILMFTLKNYQSLFKTFLCPQVTVNPIFAWLLLNLNDIFCLSAKKWLEGPIFA